MTNRLKKKTRRNYVEDKIREGLDRGMHVDVCYIKKVEHPAQNYIFPQHQRKINLYKYEFIKTYLYALFTGVINEPHIQIVNFNALASNSNPIIVAPDIVGTDENGMAIVENHTIFVNLRYMDSEYKLTVMVMAVEDGPYTLLKYFISVLGSEPDSFRTVELTDYIIKEAIRNSYYKNKILSLVCDDMNRVDINQVSIDNFVNEDLNDLFIPENIKSELVRFCLCVDKFSEIKTGLRYMLCGEPGTGKTKSVRALMKMCYGKATIILAEGDVDFRALFDFASMFQPAIICIDDIDLLIGTRDNTFSPNSLGALLQELDGFEKNNVFILATTNDKELIDKAASRPGRFDMILDYNKINKNNYLELIKSYCSTPQVNDVIDESILATLQKNKITGAYLVNLIKQLEIKYKLDPACDMRKYIRNLITLTYRGFYKNTEEKQMSFGFGNYDGNEIEIVDL